MALFLVLNNLFYDPKAMGIGIRFCAKNTGMVQSVQPNFPVGVNYIIIVHYNTHMVNNSFIVIKKG
jgi:hypothetical protein